MTDTKPEALRLAQWLETSPYHHDKKVAAELRRLHEVNQELVEALGFIIDNHAPAVADLLFGAGVIDAARAALAKARGTE